MCYGLNFISFSLPRVAVSLFFFSISIKNSLIFIQNRRHEGKM